MENTNKVIRQILSPPARQLKCTCFEQRGLVSNSDVTENKRNVQFLRQQYDFIPGARFRKVPKSQSQNCDPLWNEGFETPSFWRYKENYVSRNAPEKLEGFGETGPGTTGARRCAWDKQVVTSFNKKPIEKKSLPQKWRKKPIRYFTGEVTFSSNDLPAIPQKEQHFHQSDQKPPCCPYLRFFKA